MLDKKEVRIVLGDWADLKGDATAIRFEVFVQEQAVPQDIELDEFDDLSVHAVAYDAQGTPIATGRLLPDNHIGRMAVRKQARRAGIGGMVLHALIEQGRKEGRAAIILNAQTHARGFYELHGFAVKGGQFMEAGIPHVTMTLDLGGV